MVDRNIASDQGLNQLSSGPHPVNSRSAVANAATSCGNQKSFGQCIENPAGYSGPPHLLSPWGSAGRGGGSGLLKDTVPGRPPFHPNQRCGPDEGPGLGRTAW